VIEKLQNLVVEDFSNFLPPVIPETLLEIRLHYAALDAKEA